MPSPALALSRLAHGLPLLLVAYTGQHLKSSRYNCRQYCLPVGSRKCIEQRPDRINYAQPVRLCYRVGRLGSVLFSTFVILLDCADRCEA